MRRPLQYVTRPWLRAAMGFMCMAACSSGGAGGTQSSQEAGAQASRMNAAAVAGSGGEPSRAMSVPAASSTGAQRTSEGGAGAAAVGGAGGDAATAAGGSAGTGTGGDTRSAGASAAAAGSGSFALQAPNAMNLGMDEYAFPATALPPMNYSPELSWSGVPAGAKSLALTFTDVTSSAYKWVVWDIAPSVTHVPAHVSNMAMPMEVPGAAQLGSLGNQGYAGPCCEDHRYAFELWALDVEKLPDTARRSTADLYKTVLPMHEIVKSEPVQLRIAP